MSWLVNSIANSLNLDEDEEEDDEDANGINASSIEEDETHALSPSDGDAQRRGVKEDLSEFSKTITRQLWGAASFLTPPPSDSPQPLDRSESFDQDGSHSARIDGIRSDLSEIKGKFRTGISKLSRNKAVSEFGKIASSILQFVSEEGETIEDYAQQGVVGVTEEVVAFVRDVATHPQTWLDFPLADHTEEEEEEDFDISDIQQEHTYAIQCLEPRLASLRVELCPSYMNESHFWKIYFVLVHSRLTSQAAELLSTSQILKARAMLTNEPDISNSISDGSGGRDIEFLPSESPSSTKEEHLTVTLNDNPESLPINSTDTANTVAARHNPTLTEIPVLEELPEMDSSGVIDIPIEDDDDVSFSDLEEEDEDIPIK